MRRLPAAGFCALLLFSSALAAQTGPLLLAKNATGTLGGGALSLTLTAASCDETGALLPDGSTFVVDGFALAPENGRGTFHGFGTFQAPGGATVVLAMVHGFISEGPSCLSANPVRTVHLAATLDPVPTLAASTLLGFRADNAILDARFTLDGPAAGVPGGETTVAGTVEGLVTPAPGGEPGRVTISSDRASYGVDDVVTALVVNGSPASIVAFDGQAFCTIVGLEHRAEDGWRDVAGCPLARLPLPTKIAAGETVTVTLPPGIAPHWDPGTYRLRFAFGTVEPIPAPLAARVFSAPFEIGSSTPPPGGVDLVTSRAGYRQNERIVAFLENGTDQKLVTSDHRSYCSILTLEKQQRDGSWEQAWPCLIATPSRLVDLDSHARLAVELPPEPSPARNDPGVYRLSADVWPKSATEGGPPEPPVMHVVSAPFMVFGVRTDGPDVR